MADLNEKRVIEAALFMSGRELNLEEIRKLTGIAAFGYLQKIVDELKKEYDEKGSALEIFQVSGKYGMRIKEEYQDIVKQFAQESEISKSALRTLAYIAKHNGTLKSEMVKRIGITVYQNVKELIDSDFIKAQKAGRSARLFVTDKFRRYFRTIEQQKGADAQILAVEQKSEENINQM